MRRRQKGAGSRCRRPSPDSRSRRLKETARRWLISGHVQGVGFRWFAEKHAAEIGVRGWVRNEDDGRVHVYAVGTADQLNRFGALLRQGPAMSTVRGVEEREDAVQETASFRSR